MKQELRDKLIKDHPLLYGPTFLFECGDGWYKLLYKVSDKLEKEIKKYIVEHKSECKCGCDVSLHKDDGKCSTVYENGVKLPDGTYEDVPCCCEAFQTRHPRAGQVKEKYGTLCYYLDFGTEKMFNLSDKAEDESHKICEECGQRGWIRDAGWIRTLCDKHCVEYYDRLIPRPGFFKRIRNKLKWYWWDLKYQVSNR